MRFALTLLLLCFVTAAAAMESLTMTTPLTPPSTTTYTVQSLSITTSPAIIGWTVMDNNGNTTSGAYNGSVAVTLLHQLNTGNFSTKSLQKQIILRLQADGYLPAGSVTGTPQ